MKRTKRVIFSVIFLLSIVGGYFAYPNLIFKFFASSATPKIWNDKLYSLTKAQIINELGPPDSNMTAKDFIAWEDVQWWGRQTLMIIFRDCCVDSSVPSKIYVIKHARFRYQPIYNKDIRDVGN